MLRCNHRGGEQMTFEELNEMLIFYDTETFKYDNVAVFKRKKNGERIVFHNDSEGLQEFLQEPMVLCGYNNKGYDQYILKALLLDIPAKEVNDWIIAGNGGWEYPGFVGQFVKVPPQIDLMQDTLGLSLKEIEGNIGLNIKETEVDFNLDRPLLPSEVERTIEYCSADVDVLPALWDLRIDYIMAKVTLCEQADILLEEGLGMTNAKLTAKFLGAVKKEQPPRRDFDYTKIPGIRWEYIPLEVIEYFDQIVDESLSDEEFESSKLECLIADVPHTVALGGLHGARENCFIESDDDIVIINQDVASFYPSMILVYGYASRNIPDDKMYANVYHTRIKAKREGNKKIANALKLVLNTFYGAMNNKYNDLYDPSMALAVCVTGQLLLIELLEVLKERIPSFNLIQSNTDGIMFALSRKDLELSRTIVHEWEELHQMGMEEDEIVKVAQRDVNNYAILQSGDVLKYKGGDLSDYNKKDKWKHHSLEVCAEALVKKLIYDTPIEETILACNELDKFQMIGKTGRTYLDTCRWTSEGYVPIQRVNRIFAGQTGSGAIYKHKKEKDKEGNVRDRYDKIANCPDITLIDGYDTFTIEDIDKQWYIDFTTKKYKKFKGGKENGEESKRSKRGNGRSSGD